jgi:glyoxylase-like metal-dependent hydrolase (beta-lactamase superfamily II)
MEQIADNIYLETNFDGVTVAAIRTHEGIICIDVPSYPRQAREWMTRLHALHSRAIRYVVLTDHHGDRILNARWLNAPIIAHERTAAQLKQYDKRYPQPLIESLISRNPDRSRDFRNSPVSQVTIHFTHDMHLQKGALDLRFLARTGPTNGSIWVHSPRNNLLFVGDTVPVGRPPLLQWGETAVWLQRLDELRQWLPNHQIISGRGGLISAADIDAAEEYINAVQAQISAHIAAGKGRELLFTHAKAYVHQFAHTNLPPDWLRGQIKLSLEHVYDELQYQQEIINQNPTDNVEVVSE